MPQVSRWWILLLATLLARGDLHVELLSRGVAWLDAGTPGSLNDAADFVRSIENRQGLKIACLEEIAMRMGYVSAESLQSFAQGIAGPYGEYLRNVINGRLDPLA